MREKYLLGEIFPVKFLVHSTSWDPFRVLSADWELLSYGNKESSGECDITTDDDGNTYLGMTLEPQKTGKYTLVVTFAIGEYVFKRDVDFEVSEP